jgi:hypothetical protein
MPVWVAKVRADFQGPFRSRALQDFQKIGPRGSAPRYEAGSKDLLFG